MNDSNPAISILKIEFVTNNVSTNPDGVTGKMHQTFKEEVTAEGVRWLKESAAGPGLRCGC